MLLWLICAPALCARPADADDVQHPGVGLGAGVRWDALFAVSGTRAVSLHAIPTNTYVLCSRLPRIAIEASVRWRNGVAISNRLGRGSFETPRGMGGLQLVNSLSVIRGGVDRKSTRLNSSHIRRSRMPSYA